MSVCMVNDVLTLFAVQTGFYVFNNWDTVDEINIDFIREGENTEITALSENLAAIKR